MKLTLEGAPERVPQMRGRRRRRGAYDFSGSSAK